MICDIDISTPFILLNITLHPKHKTLPKVEGRMRDIQYEGWEGSESLYAAVLMIASTLIIIMVSSSPYHRAHGCP